ncbi:MAG: hypothetical protein KF911_02210 [Pseudomonadales bacterium]|nr:hypothetical protein [Pseudomonadales bacterium]
MAARATKALLLFSAQAAWGWEPECAEGYPTFRTEPPEIRIEKDGSGNVDIFIRREHENLQVSWLTLYIEVQTAVGAREIEVPMAFYREGDDVVTGVFARSVEGITKYHLSVKYSDHDCGPRISADFTP